MIKNWEERGLFNRGPSYDLYKAEYGKYGDKP